MISQRLQQLQSLLENSPNDPFLWYALAKEYEKLERTEEALAQYQALTEQHPEYVGTYYHYAKLLEEEEQFATALAIYRAGMAVARQQGDLHALGELSNAKTNLELEL